MAKDTGKEYRRGSVDNRTQFQAPSGNYVKRNTDDGRFMQQKVSGGPFKGVAHEVDKRRS